MLFEKKVETENGGRSAESVPIHLIVILCLFHLLSLFILCIIILLIIFGRQSSMKEVTDIQTYGKPEGTFPFRYLLEKKSKQEIYNVNKNNKYLV